MKKLLSVFFAVLLLLGATACARPNRSVTCEEVIAAYEAAGYEVFHQADSEYIFEEDCVCYVRADHPELEENIYFRFFIDSEAALRYAEEKNYYWAASIFSLFLWDPTWIRMEVNDNVVIDYSRSELYQPYKELLQE